MEPEGRNTILKKWSVIGTPCLNVPNVILATGSQTSLHRKGSFGNKSLRSLLFLLWVFIYDLSVGVVFYCPVRWVWRRVGSYGVRHVSLTRRRENGKSQESLHSQNWIPLESIDLPPRSQTVYSPSWNLLLVLLGLVTTGYLWAEATDGSVLGL